MHAGAWSGTTRRLRPVPRSVKALPGGPGPPYARRMSTRDETGAGPNPDAGRDERVALDDDELTRKDVSYSPASEQETAAKQRDPLPDGIDDDIDTSRIRAVPGTGGPDDAGDVDLDREEVEE